MVQIEANYSECIYYTNTLTEDAFSTSLKLAMFTNIEF